MCIETIAAVAGIAGTALSAAGTVQQGQAQAANARYQAQISANNAALAQFYADDAIARGAEEADLQSERARAIAGQQTAALAASGIDVQSGTALGVLGDTAEAAEIDRLTIRDNAAREAYRYQVDAANAQAQAAASSSVQTGSFLSAGGSLLTGLGGVGERWQRYRVQTRNTGTAST